MTIKSYMSGSLVRTSAAFADITGAAADPSTVVLKYRKDAGATTTVTYPSAPVIKDGTGLYHADLDTTGFAGPGAQYWAVEWTGTGAQESISSDEWTVTPAAL